MRWIAMCLLFLAIATPLRAEQADQTLQYFMSNSTFVVSATIASEPDAKVDELGVVQYYFDIQINDFLHGAKPKEDKIHVHMTRFEMGRDDAIPFLKKDARCILFLTLYEYYSVADMWFGIQPFNSQMASRIRELSRKQAKK